MDGSPYQVMFRQCALVEGRLKPRGGQYVMSITDAVKRLAPTGSRSGRVNVLSARRGDFIGIRSDTSANFIIRNPTDDGDIRWLLRDNPGFENNFDAIYRIEGVLRQGQATEISVDKPVVTGESW